MGIAFKCRKSESLCFKGVTEEFELHFLLICLPLLFLQGLAYVDFLDNKHLEAAIKKNKQKLLGKKVSIARSDPSKGKKSREAGQTSQGMFFAREDQNSDIFFVFSKLHEWMNLKQSNYYLRFFIFDVS